MNGCGTPAPSERRSSSYPEIVRPQWDGRAEGGLSGGSAAQVGFQWTIGRRVSVAEAMPATRDGLCAVQLVIGSVHATHSKKTTD